MRFLLTLSPDAKPLAGPPSPELMAAIDALTEEMTEAGILLDTGGMAPPSHSARLQLAGGRVTVTDGPFTEAKELVGGYAIVKVDSREEALALARRFLQIHADILGPSYEMSTEVRQLFSPEDFEPAAAPSVDQAQGGR